MKRLFISLLILFSLIPIFAYGQVEAIATATPTIFPEKEIGVFKAWTGTYNNYYDFIDDESLTKQKQIILKAKPSYTKQGFSSFLHDTYYSPIKTLTLENNTIIYDDAIKIEYKFIGSVKIGHFPLYYFKSTKKNVDKKYKVVLITESRGNVEHLYYFNFYCGASISDIKRNLTLYPTFYNSNATKDDKIQFFNNKLYDITLKPALHEYNGTYEGNVVIKAPNITIDNVTYVCTRIADEGDDRAYKTDRGINLYIKKEYVKYESLTYKLGNQMPFKSIKLKEYNTY